MIDFLLVESEFIHFGNSHRIVLLLLILGAICAVLLGRKLKKSKNLKLENKLNRCFAIAVLVVQLPLQIYSMLPQHWSLANSLPFQLCDLAWMATIYALWTQKKWAYSLVYYWGLTLTSQAFLTPILQFDFPHLQFTMFWLAHAFVVLAAIYLTWGLGNRPRWKDFKFAYLFTLSWMAFVFVFNLVFDTNYLYLNDKPLGTIMDAFGPWPIYILVEMAIIAIVWSAMTYPWNKKV